MLKYFIFLNLSWYHLKMSIIEFCTSTCLWNLYTLKMFYSSDTFPPEQEDHKVLKFILKLS